MKPLDIHFNVAVMTIARRLFPAGWDVTMDANKAPYDLESLTAHIADTGRMLVWGGSSDSTIFACPEHNYAFRAWHDWCHWHLQVPMDDEGEYLTYLLMCQHLAEVYPGDTHNKRLWFTILYIEIVEMNRYFHRTGMFPEDQRAFVEQGLHTLRHVVMNPLGDQKAA